MKNLLATAVLLVTAGLTSCATSSNSFVEGQAGVAVIKGRITEVHNLSAGSIKRLGDGLAVTVSKPGCRVSLLFENNESKVMDLEPGTMIIYGDDTDYVVRSAPGTPTR